MQPTRRQTLAGIATTATAGIALTHAPTAYADATVSNQGLTIPDSTHQTDGQTVTQVPVTVSAEYAYESTHTPDTVSITLLSGDSDTTLQPLTSQDLQVNGLSDNGTVELSGDVLSTYHYTADDFSPSEGNTVTQVVWIGLELVVTRGGETLASERVVDSAQITSDGTVVSATGALGGDGTIDVET